jgi:gas vesicle protein
MASKTIPYLFVAAGAFLGGVALGLLVSPQSGRDNREMIRKKSNDMAKFVAQQGRKVKADVSKEMKRNFPDLYAATTDIELDENDVLTGKA